MFRVLCERGLSGQNETSNLDSVVFCVLADDHSRIVLERDNIDYINANLVLAPEANRKYILTQVRMRAKPREIKT